MSLVPMIRTDVTAMILALPLLLAIGCVGAGPQQTAVEAVTPAYAQTLIQDNVGNPDFVLLDVRNPDEFAADHIAGAVNLCFRCDTFSDNLATLDKSKTYLVYCASDNRSGQATAQMEQQGFLHQYDLTGGINRWKAENLPVVE